MQVVKVQANSEAGWMLVDMAHQLMQGGHPTPLLCLALALLYIHDGLSEDDLRAVPEEERKTIIQHIASQVSLAAATATREATAKYDTRSKIISTEIPSGGETKH